MSVHKIDISKDWKLAYLKKQTKTRWYRYFGDWEIAEFLRSELLWHQFPVS